MSTLLGGRAGRGAPSAGGRSWTLTVAHHARGARQARQHLARHLAELVAPAILADAITVVAELFGNAVRHAAPLPGGVMLVGWWVGPASDAFVRLEVTDGGAAHAPTVRVAEPDALDGRGLAIVVALARRWGVDREGDRQRVWAELGPSVA